MKRIILTILLGTLFSLTGNASAAVFNTYFTDANPANHLWSNVGNWDNGLPTISEGQAVIDATVTCEIDSTVTAECYNFYFGNNSTVGEGPTLNITGGSLTTPYNFYLQVNGDTVATINMSGGTVNADHLTIGMFGNGVLNMTGGTINLTSQLWIPWGNNGVWQGETADVNLDGGVINCATFHMHEYGSLDITDGTLVINGNATSEISLYVTNGWITAYDGNGIVQYDYSVSNSGKTTVTGSCLPEISNPNPSDGETISQTEQILSWDAGCKALSHDVYFGTDCNDVNDADGIFPDLDESHLIDFEDLLILALYWLDNPVGVEPSPDLSDDNNVDLVDFAILGDFWHEQGIPGVYKGNTTSTNYGPITLEVGQTYCWRIDELNDDQTVTKGQVRVFDVNILPDDIDIVSNWKFKTDPNDEGVAGEWYFTDFNDSSWDILQAAQSWEEQGYPAYDGYGWYRKWVFVPQDWVGFNCYVVFGGVDDEYTFCINGEAIAHHGSQSGGESVWNTVTYTEISSYLNLDSNNLIALRVEDWGSNGGIVSEPVIISATFDITNTLSLDEFFARSDLTPEEEILKAVIFHSSTYDPVWRASNGFIPPPRIIGFVADDSYCQQYAPVLRDNIDHPNPEVRFAVAQRLAELKGAEGFEILLDALKDETNAAARGGNKWLFEPGISGIADRLIAMIGHPDTYDPYGTQALRDAVIERWRSRWYSEGESWLRGLAKAQNYSPVTGDQKLVLQGQTVATRSMPDMEEFFFLSSSKIYEFAAMDSRFPPAGWLSGDDAGIWSHPVKAMDGFEFTIKESGFADWTLLDCNDFVQKLHSCEFNFAQNNLSITRKDFAVEDEPALFTILTLNNDTGQARTIDVEFSGRVNIRPAWYSAWTNDLDVLSYDATNFSIDACDSTTADWATVFGSDQVPVDYDIAGNRGILTYSLNLPASGSSEIAFLIVADHNSGVSAAKAKFNSLISQRSALWTQRESLYQQKMFNDVNFTCSNADVTNAFACAKANIMMMTLDAQPYHVGPYFLGGIPEYSGLFSCDTEYGIAGASAGGSSQAAKGNLKCLANFAQIQSGRVPHLVTTNGIIIVPGNSQETQQFVVACGKYFDWTGDVQFISDYYSQFSQCINWVLTNRDTDGDHYPEGYSLIETGGMNGENIDSACYLYKAFDVMANFADILGNTSDASLYTTYAANMKNNFNVDYWNASQQMWADALVSGSGSQQMLGYFVRNMPQEIAIADPNKAVAVLDEMEAWGTDRYCPYTNGIVVLGAYNYGDAEQGWTRLKWSAEAPMDYGMLGGFENVTVTPDDIPLIESPTLYVQGIVEGLCGISPSAVDHKVEIFPQAPNELDDLSLNNLQIGQHLLNLSWDREMDDDIEMNLLHVSGPNDLDVLLRVKAVPGQTIKLNGGVIDPNNEVIRGIDTEPIDITLSSGQSAIVRLE